MQRTVRECAQKGATCPRAIAVAQGDQAAIAQCARITVTHRVQERTAAPAVAFRDAAGEEYEIGLILKHLIANRTDAVLNEGLVEIDELAEFAQTQPKIDIFVALRAAKILAEAAAALESSTPYDHRARDNRPPFAEQVVHRRRVRLARWHQRSRCGRALIVNGQNVRIEQHRVRTLIERSDR